MNPVTLHCAIRQGLMALCLTLLLAPAWAQKRVALLVGNGQYQHESALANPVNDVRLLASVLRGSQLNFKVEVLENLPRREMDLAIKRFVRESAGADTALLYYAGHGAQPTKGGRSYLLPVNAKAVDDDSLETDGILAESIASQLEQQANPAKLRLVVLDACRNTRMASSSRSTVRGLAPPARTDSYTLIAYSTDANAVAQDGSGSNSPYAKALAQHLPRAAKEPVRMIFEDTAKDVRAATKQTQAPRTYGDLESRVGLDGVQVASLKPESTGRANQGDPEEEAWQATKAANTAAAYEAYLAEYPKGRYASAARIGRVAGQGSNSPQAASQQTSQQRPGSANNFTAGQVFKDCADCPEMVVVPLGSFTMGSSAAEQAAAVREGMSQAAADRESPQHMVRIGYRFALGKYELSRGEFARFVSATAYKTEAEKGNSCAVMKPDGSGWEMKADANWQNPGFAQGDDHPVVCVSWNDAQAYISWLNQKNPGQAYRLPSEAEWEYAARAGSQTRYPWGEDEGNQQICRQANHGEQSYSAQYPKDTVVNRNCSDGVVHTTAGSRFPANTFGLHNMHGNVHEWVQDWYHDNYSAAPTDGSAWESGGEQKYRVLRGGSWSNLPASLRSAYRLGYAPGSRSSGSGFRLARTLFTP